MRHLLWILLLMTGAAQAAPADEAARKAVSDFYTAYLELKPGGVPDATQRAKLRPRLSSGLNDLLAAADAAEARYAEKTRKEVPPLAQGDLFTSLFEGATRFTLGTCVGYTVSASCSVELTYQEGGGPATTWQDRIMIQLTSDGWVVEDIEYGGAWAFARRGRLSEVLKAIVREADRQ